MLLNQGWEEKKVNDRFNMQRRIDEEEKVIANADVVIVSTRHEIETQYMGYHNRLQANFKNTAGS
ncbi:hypothetical protein LWM68_01175 [Niabella sp. W65]|nr:hypothetical protein [Niabella sp. W65]MCH7361516.1 hypothetical protein [Niabella sp. W65]ULT45313.1 hypothetical protein KRR40_19750 [Niabella sp. I65]